tara:strand:+ start:1403 stop:1906 length:504 start_codon:yes stop_codon:yes gene_type:complete
MYKIHNVLSNQERKKLIKDIQPFLMDGEQLGKYYNTSLSFPGKQTIADLHQQPEFFSVIKKIEDIIKKEIDLDLKVEKSWIKYSNSNTQLNWHSHYPQDNVSFASVYYLQTLPFVGNGTLFEDGFVRAPQNSIIIFPAHLLHTTPKNLFPFIDRYVMSFNLNIRNSV